MLKLIHNDPIDYEILQHLYRDEQDLKLAFPEAKFPFCSEEWDKWIGPATKSTSLIFKHDANIIAHVALRPNSQGHLYLCFVILEKTYRGRGLIYEMLSQIESYAASQYGNESIYLHVDPNNLPALNAYQKFGYVPVVITEKNRLRMVKSIGASCKRPAS